jgi:hypothetical protein
MGPVSPKERIFATWESQRYDLAGYIDLEKKGEEEEERKNK